MNKADIVVLSFNKFPAFAFSLSVDKLKVSEWNVMKYIVLVLLLFAFTACNKKTEILPDTEPRIDFREKYKGSYMITYRKFYNPQRPGRFSYDTTYNIILKLDIPTFDSVQNAYDRVSVQNPNKKYAAIAFCDESGKIFERFGIEDGGKLHAMGSPIIGPDSSYITADSIISHYVDMGVYSEFWLKGYKIK